MWRVAEADAGDQSGLEEEVSGLINIRSGEDCEKTYKAYQAATLVCSCAAQ